MCAEVTFGNLCTVDIQYVNVICFNTNHFNYVYSNFKMLLLFKVCNFVCNIQYTLYMLHFLSSIGTVMLLYFSFYLSAGLWVNTDS